ncbi:MAG TPA: mucoidy inhibitor MuiA family protein [Flammeovirgaceae bacterium]|nr:mucoidy inhibitor MuiA family protein [Flammeovirgaceae bacterium]
MKQLYFLLLGMACSLAYAQPEKPNHFKTTIKQVKVFLHNAEITRTGNIYLLPGDTTLVLSGLSPYMDKKSIQVRGEGDFKILAVNHQYDFLSVRQKHARTQLLSDSIKMLEAALQQAAVQLELLEQKIDFLNSNKKISPAKLGDVEKLQKVLQFYETELQAACESKMQVENHQKELNKLLNKYQAELKQLVGKDEMPASEIHLVLRVLKAGKADFTVSYLAGNAGWFPKYDIRARDVASPVEIDYKASLYQNTGEDWKDVRLIFSNIDANESGLAPELPVWKLNYDRLSRRANSNYRALVEQWSGNRLNEIRGRVVSAEDGSPIPGVNVVVKGSTTGAVTDFEGNYSLVLPNNATTLVFSFIGMQTQEVELDGSRVIDVALEPDAQALSEVVVTALGISREKASLGYSTTTIGADKLSGRVAGVSIRGNSSVGASSRSSYRKTVIQGVRVQNQTSVDFVIEEPYSLKSNAQPLLIDLQQYEVEALFDYFTVPKLNSSVFLIAKIYDWNKLGFLEGEANLYFEQAFVGKSILETGSFGDTLRISLGRDRSVVVKREKMAEFTKRKAFGNNNVERTGIKLTVRNNKTQPIVVNILDQIPVSVNSNINVYVLSTGEGQLNKDTGKIRWQLPLQPDEQRELLFSYEVKYPRFETVSLE